MTNLQQLRVHAISHSLFHPLTLKAAIQRMGFVQADPIRSPARAQDLILRHRVENYKAGDLERHYRSLDIEEDYLYAYGFLHSQSYGNCFIRGRRLACLSWIKRFWNWSAPSGPCTRAIRKRFRRRAGHQCLGRLLEGHQARS